MATLSGGDKLIQVLEGMSDKLKSAGSRTIGFHAGNFYDDAAHTPVAAAAFWNEYGTVKIPPRPFFRTAISNNSSEWGDVAVRAAKAGLSGGDLLDVVAYKIRDDVKMSINNWQDPKNADSTVAKKGFNKPLIHTNLMRDSVEVQNSND